MQNTKVTDDTMRSLSFMLVGVAFCVAMYQHNWIIAGILGSQWFISLWWSVE